MRQRSAAEQGDTVRVQVVSKGREDSESHRNTNPKTYSGRSPPPNHGPYTRSSQIHAGFPTTLAFARKQRSNTHLGHAAVVKVVPLARLLIQDRGSVVAPKQVATVVLQPIQHQQDMMYRAWSDMCTGNWLQKRRYPT